MGCWAELVRLFFCVFMGVHDRQDSVGKRAQLSNGGAMVSLLQLDYGKNSLPMRVLSGLASNHNMVKLALPLLFEFLKYAQHHHKLVSLLQLPSREQKPREEWCTV